MEKKLVNPVIVSQPKLVNPVQGKKQQVVNNPYLSYRRKLRYDMFRRS